MVLSTRVLFGAIMLAAFSSVARADEKPPVREGGEKPAVKRDGENPAKPGERDGERGLRAVLKSFDVEKGVMTVVISNDGGTTVRTFNLAGKDIKVSGVAGKLADLREGLQVFLKLTDDEDVLAIHTDKVKRNSKSGRIYAAYDKNSDEKVMFEEWLSMKEGVDAARKARERVYFDSADANRDGAISFAEFENWLENRGRQPEANRPAPERNLPNPLQKKE